MTNRNPYENGVDIPEFVEKNDNDIDMSVFKMANNGGDNYDVDDDDEYEDDEPRQLSSKGLLIICIILCALLLIGTITGWVYGISKKNAYNKLDAEYTTLKEKNDALNSEVSSYQSQVADLQAQIEELTTKKEEEGSTEGDYTTYKMKEVVTVRTGAGTKYDIVDYNDLSTENQDNVYYDKATKMVTTRESATVKVYETKAVDSMTWGRIDSSAWVCLINNGESYAVKQ